MTRLAPLADPLGYAIPGFALLILAEMLISRRVDSRRYGVHDTYVSLMLGVGSSIAGAATGGLVYLLWLAVYRHHLLDIPMALPGGWWSWPLCFVLVDLAYYWFHRASHRIRWGWAAHVNHHSSQHYNLSTALRQTWTGFIAGSFLFYIPLIWIGFPPPMVLFCYALNLIYQFWIHTEVITRCPRWFEAVMNTPAHHRVHHATNPRYLDRNYAGVFIVWDRCFGSFTPEREDDRCRYGLVHNLDHFSLIATAFHEWIAIGRDLRSAPWRSKLGYAFGPPGWSHDNSRDTSDAIRARWQEQNREEKAGWKNSISSSSAGDRAAAPVPDASPKADGSASV